MALGGLARSPLAATWNKAPLSPLAVTVAESGADPLSAVPPRCPLGPPPWVPEGFLQAWAAAPDPRGSRQMGALFCAGIFEWLFAVE